MCLWACVHAQKVFSKKKRVLAQWMMVHYLTELRVCVCVCVCVCVRVRVRMRVRTCVCIWCFIAEKAAVAHLHPALNHVMVLWHRVLALLRWASTLIGSPVRMQLPSSIQIMDLIA